MSIDNNAQVDPAFQREARTGLMIVVSLLVIFCYVAAGKLGGWYAAKPPAFQEKPLAQQNQNANPGIADNDPLNQEGQTAQSRKPNRQLDPDSLLSTNRLAVPSEPVYSPAAPDVARPSMPSRAQTAQVSSTEGRPVQPLPSRPFKSGGGSFKGIAQQIPQRPDSSNPLMDRASQVPNLSHNSIRQASAEEPVVGPRLLSRPANSSDKQLPKTTIPNELDVLIAQQDQEQAKARANRPSASTETKNANQNPNSQLPGNDGDALPRQSLEPTSQIESLDAVAELASKTSAAEIEVIEGDDSFWLISQRVYGDGRFFNALFMENKDAVPSFNEIPVGTIIRTPSIAALQAKWPSQCPRRKLVTEGGETPFGLACEHLGQASRYLDILKVNYQVLPTDAQHDTELPAGLELILPRK